LLSLKCSKWHLSVTGRKAKPFCISKETLHLENEEKNPYIVGDET
jgi:hypothetical protein